MGIRGAVALCSIAIVLGATSARAQSHGSTELAREHMHAYFDGEIRGGYGFMATGAALIGGGSALWLSKEDAGRGAAYPMLGVGALQLIAGAAFAFGSPARVDTFDTQLSDSPAAFQRDELERMNGVNATVSALEIAELTLMGLGLITAAIGLVLEEDTLTGIGAGTTLSIGSVFVQDLLVHSRAREYRDNLKRFRPGVTF